MSNTSSLPEAKRQHALKAGRGPGQSHRCRCGLSQSISSSHMRERRGMPSSLQTLPPEPSLPQRSPPTSPAQYLALALDRLSRSYETARMPSTGLLRQPGGFEGRVLGPGTRSSAKRSCFRRASRQTCKNALANLDAAGADHDRLMLTAATTMSPASISSSTPCALVLPRFARLAREAARASSRPRITSTSSSRREQSKTNSGKASSRADLVPTGERKRMPAARSPRSPPTSPAQYLALALEPAELANQPLRWVARGRNQPIVVPFRPSEGGGSPGGG